MALSNWDTLAINLDGQPTNGTFESPNGVTVSLYKNWLYVYDAQAWREGGGYTKPCVAEMQHGEIHYMDVRIQAVRGPQCGVYAVVTNGYGNKMTGMIGCGVAGYDDAGNFIGVEEKSRRFLRQFACGNYQPDHEEVIRNLKHQMIYHFPEDEPEVLTNAYDDAEQRGDLEEIISIWSSITWAFPEKVRQAAVKIDQAVRFNQGDAYFAKAFGQEIPATDVGKQEPPMLSQALKKDE